MLNQNPCKKLMMSKISKIFHKSKIFLSALLTLCYCAKGQLIFNQSLVLGSVLQTTWVNGWGLIMVSKQNGHHRALYRGFFFFFFNYRAFINVFFWFKIWEDILIWVHRCTHFSFASGPNKTAFRSTEQDVLWMGTVKPRTLLLKSCFTEGLWRIQDKPIHSWTSGE